LIRNGETFSTPPGSTYRSNGSAAAAERKRRAGGGKTLNGRNLMLAASAK
jgi:hypothetical protein